MKRILLAGAVAFAAMGPALAADLPQPYSPPPPRAPATYVPTVAPVYNWGGIYVGVNGGYGFGNSDWEPLGLAPSGNFNVSGGLVGGTIGANYQMGQFVMGIEGDFDWSGLTGNTINGACVGITCTTSSDWLATVRGRAGFAMDRVLLYATGGAAFGDVKASIPAGATSTTEFGWTAGAGVEFAITDNLTAKAEYLFVDLSNASCSAASCGPSFGVTADTPVKFDASLIRAGLNFKFNGF